jgi:hypothetical protein
MFRRTNNFWQSGTESSRAAKLLLNATNLHPQMFSAHHRIAQINAAPSRWEDKESTVTFDRHLPLDERILRIDHIQARRYSKLTGVALEIATQGIIRHLRACDRMDVNPDTSAVREIIDDALNGRRVFAETAEQTQAA